MTTLTRLTNNLISLRVIRTSWAQYSLFAIWILAMIALPIMKWNFGVTIIPGAVTLALMAQFLAVLAALLNHIGPSRTLQSFVIVAAATWGIEFIGSSTGFPFGVYSYTNALQPQIGHVPLLIPMAWFMMLPAAWAIASMLAGKNRLLYVLISAGAITAWDLFLDPQMVEWSFWTWARDGGYFGIPWSNYAGWLLTGVVVTLLVRPYRFELPVGKLLLIYGIVWFLQTFGQAFFWGQPGPAAVGGIVMGTFLLAATWHWLKQRRDILPDDA